MARHKVLEPSFIGNRFVDVGVIVTDDDLNGSAPGENLEALDPLDHDGDGKRGGSKPRAKPDAE